MRSACFLIACLVLVACEESELSFAARTMQQFHAAIKNTADRVRREEKKPSKMTGMEFTSYLTDYATQQLERPVMLSVEENFVRTHKNIRRLTRTIKRLHRVIHKLAKDCGSDAADSQRCVDPAFSGNPSHDSCDEVLKTRLVRVQGPSYSIIGKNAAPQSP